MKQERTGSPEARQGRRAWTIGHSNVPLEDFLSLLDCHRIERVADVRRYPGSRRHPQFDRESLEAALTARGIAYRWFEDLGGRRSGLGSRSPNRGIESIGFRGYADYMQSIRFARAFDDLLVWLDGGRTALVCAESLWWKCHRRLLSDLLVRCRAEVTHILPDGRTAPHEIWDLARPTPEGLVYPPIQADLEI